MSKKICFTTNKENSLVETRTIKGIAMIGAIGSGSVVHVENIRTGFQEISSGKKSVTTMSPALLEIGQRLMNSATFAEARNRNITNHISKSHTESAFVQNAQDSLSRISELSVRANSGILNSQDRKALELEAQELSSHLSFNREHAKFNGQQIMNDDQFNEITDSLKNIDFSSSEGVQATAEAAMSAMDMLSSRQAGLGSEQVILEQQFSANLQEQANLMDAGSRLMDTDIAAAFTQLTGDMIMSDVSSAMSGQAVNMESSTVSALLS